MRSVMMLEALRLNPKLSDAYVGRGWVYLRKNEMDKAIADLNECIRLDPNSQSAYYNRAAHDDRLWLTHQVTAMTKTFSPYLGFANVRFRALPFLS